MFEPVDSQILKDFSEISDSKNKNFNRDKNINTKLRYTRKFSKEITLRLLVFNSEGEWQRKSTVHFNIGGSVIPCFDAITLEEKLDYAEKYIFKNYFYDEEKKEKIPIVYDLKLKDYYFKKFFNLEDKSKFNPKSVLNEISVLRAEEEITLGAIRETAQYLSHKCPVCELIKTYENMGLSNNTLWKYKSAISHKVNVIDMEALRNFDLFLKDRNINISKLDLREIEEMVNLYEESENKFSIRPTIFSFSNSLYNKILNDLSRQKGILSPSAGIAIILRYDSKNKLELSYDLVNLNKPIHENPDMMKFIGDNIFDLNKRLLPPSLKMIEKQFEFTKVFSDELKSIYENSKNNLTIPPSENPGKITYAFEDSKDNLDAIFPHEEQISRPPAYTSSFQFNNSLKYKDLAIKKLGSVPECYGDKNVFNIKNIKCVICNAVNYCSEDTKQGK